MKLNDQSHLDNGILRAIAQSEIEGGVSLQTLPPGTLLEVQTRNTIYGIESRDDGKVLICGSPKFCPEPLLVQFHGSTWGTPMIKSQFIGRGMQMEFAHPEYGVVLTTRVREIRQVHRTTPPAQATAPAPVPNNDEDPTSQLKLRTNR